MTEPHGLASCALDRAFLCAAVVAVASSLSACTDRAPTERPAQSTAAEPRASSPLQRVVRSRYRLLGDKGPLGFTDLTAFIRADGSRSHLARERMEFWGPVLDRFVVLTFDPAGQFDSGHWVGTSRYSPAFTYTMRFDGRVVRGDWDDESRGRGWSEVPARPGMPVMGFWGPLESLLLARFDPSGPSVQRFEALDVEDSHHRLLETTVERIGTEQIDAPAGRFTVTHYRSERFGPTDHWVDEKGTLIRWASENGTYRWDLDAYPTEEPLRVQTATVASGMYEVSSRSRPGLDGEVTWTIGREGDGSLRLIAEERLATRSSRFDGRLDTGWHWTGSTETVRWISGEGQAPPEIHHLETFFYRTRIHLLRFRDRAYPLLQSRAVDGTALFLPLNYPVAAAAFLRGFARTPGTDQGVRAFAHISNRFRGGGMEVQEARVRYEGSLEVDTPAGRASGHRFVVRYDGGWEDATIELWTDAQFVPVRVHVNATDGPVEYRLTTYQLADPSLLPR